MLPSPGAPPRRRRSLLGPILALIVLVIVGVVIWRLVGTGGAPARATPPQTVGVVAARTGDMPVEMTALGTVTPLATVTVRTQIAGQLVKIGFAEGQEVKKGDFLAQVDDRPYQALLEQYQGTLGHDQGLLAQAKADYQRYSTLNKQDSISRQQVDDQFYLIKQYEGSVASDQAQIDAQKLNIAYCHIIAPVDGRVGLRQVDAGNYVQTSDTNGIVVITQLKPISVLFTLPEDAIPQVTKRMGVAGALPVAAWDRANTTKIAEGKLETLDNEVDTTTGTVKLRALFDNTDEALFPNQFVNARLLVDTLHNTILVPSAAIQRGAPGTFVYVVGSDKKVAVKPVTIGPADAQNTAVLKGLTAGETVVVDGADRLREGAEVATADSGAAGDGRRHKRDASGQPNAAGDAAGGGPGTAAPAAGAGSGDTSGAGGSGNSSGDPSAQSPSDGHHHHHRHNANAGDGDAATGDDGKATQAAPGGGTQGPAAPNQ